ncbi:MAG TPA: proline racemase family protein [Gemmatimonadaceae bacterium]|nr:proline racemase family protein [Gemmatimonadaceae bacterium]
MSTAAGTIDAIEVVDSHTEGEPTRVVIAGWPLPNGTTMAERRESMRRDQDRLRQAVILEPRGHDAVVGALLTPAVSPGAATGVVFFNDVGYLGMCGHGLIGVVRTLEHLGRIGPGAVCVDTPVGLVRAELARDGSVSLENVPSFVHREEVALEVPGVGAVCGDVAWGGNWFFLTELDGAELGLSRVRELTQATMAIRDALARAGVRGEHGAPVDHIELFGPPAREDADSRNFVLCPGAAYDRSPCGTGTSAKMATLHTRGKLRAGERWRQESITGSLFTGWVEERAGMRGVIPHIEGRAFVTGRATLLFDPRDPFRLGIAAA